MPFDWQEYFSLARELSQRNEEAALRSAISVQMSAQEKQLIIRHSGYACSHINFVFDI